MATIKQKVVIAKKKSGGTKGIAVRKSSGLIVIKKDSSGNIINVTKQPGHLYINGVRYMPD